MPHCTTLVPTASDNVREVRDILDCASDRLKPARISLGEVRKQGAIDVEYADNAVARVQRHGNL